ncbi:restriction endonuclease subunit S [Thalassolituus oleivorans]|uniref:restriction endonuclease subunit S n=1 Tax=Thalassolituus oleivorans TaxID=187493 RepID=UPI0023F59116|nr:restriction endonuclease subunit S [Thalassolituus oleivorans]
MSAEWPLKTLSDFIKIKHGFAFKGEYFKNEATDDLLVTPGNFAIGGGFKADKFKYYDGPVAQDYILQKGDLVVTMTDLSKQADTLGYSAIIPYFLGKRLLHNQRVGLVDFKNNEIDKTYLYFLLRSKEYRNHVLGGVTGTTVKHTSPTKILSYQFRKPAIEKQVEIGRQLIVLEKKIQLNRQINQTLESMAQAIFQSWFVDFDPVKAKIAAREQWQILTDDERTEWLNELLDKQAFLKTCLSELTANGEQNASETLYLNITAMTAISSRNETSLADMPADEFSQLYKTASLFPERLVESELGEIPEGWEVRSLSHQIELIGGGTPKRSEEKFWNGDIPWFSVKDVPSDGNVFVIETEERITEIGLKKSSTKILKEGTTIVTARGTVGKLALVGVDMCMNQSCYGVVGNNTGPYFNYFNLQGAVETLKRNTHGAVFDTITTKTFDTYKSSCGPTYISDEFESLITPLMKNIKDNLFQISTLSNLRDSLLPKLLSGELEVQSNV